MRLTEVEKDLFSVDPQYSLVHCVSADFALGAGIAKQFDTRFNMRYELFEKYGSYHFTGGKCLKIGSVFNLVLYLKHPCSSLKKQLCLIARTTLLLP